MPRPVRRYADRSMDEPDDATVASREDDLALLRGLLCAGRASEVLRLLDGWTPRDRSSHPESLVLLCDAHLALGSTDAAIAAARAAAAAAGGHLAPAADASLAFALARRADAGALAEARATLDRAAAVIRERHDAVSARVRHADGVVRLREGRLEEARTALLDALADAAASSDD